jgi:hypothetical protein
MQSTCNREQRQAGSFDKKVKECSSEYVAACIKVVWQSQIASSSIAMSGRGELASIKVAWNGAKVVRPTTNRKERGVEVNCNASSGVATGKGLRYSYSISNGPSTIDSMRHDPKKHDPSPARGTINSA